MCSGLRLTRAENDVRDPRLINPKGGAQSSARNNERAVAAANPDARRNVLVSISTLLHYTGNERANGHLENREYSFSKLKECLFGISSLSQCSPMQEFVSLSGHRRAEGTKSVGLSLPLTLLLIPPWQNG